MTVLAPQDVEKKSAPEISPAAAAERIREAVKQGAGPAKAMIDKFGRIANKEITAAVAKGLKHKEQVVQLSAVHALRFNKDESAFKELFKVRSSKALLGNPDVAGDYYLALGQHANKKALPFMLRDLEPKGRRDKVIGKRLLALGKMRDRATVDAIIKFMRRIRGKSNEASVALEVLTGRRERGWVGWARWWKAERSKFEFPNEEPKLGDRSEKIWTAAWIDPGLSDAEKRALRKAAARKRLEEKKAAKKKRKQGGSDGDAKGGTGGEAAEKKRTSRRGKRGRGRGKDERT